ncbi:MAG: permease-like cell division protein FtsX [Bdellovibrionaceae bacterium]|nr:permease-like cell division protein FtsX [Pseudobdellovibrionaceae bacterium]
MRIIHTNLKIYTIVALTASYSLLLLGILLSKNVQSVLGRWGEEENIAIYLRDDLDSHGTEQLRHLLETKFGLQSIKFVGREQAVDEFVSQLGQTIPDLVKDEEILKGIPNSFVARVAVDSTSEPLAKLAEAASKIKLENGVDEVVFGSEWLKEYSNAIMAARSFSLFFCLALFGSAILIISNAIRATVADRRYEIGVLELIGATSWTIRRPFLLEGALIGFISTILAVVFIYIAWVCLLRKLNELGFFDFTTQLRFLSFSDCLLFVSMGVILGLIGSWICIRKVNSGWSSAG